MHVARTRAPAALIIMLTLLVAACGDDPVEPEVELVEVEDVTFAPSLAVDLSQMTRLESGVYIQDLHVPEEGQAAFPLYFVTARYSAWIHDGTTLAEDEDWPRFLLGAGEVISGWDLGIRNMLVGGKRRIIVPPGRAFGANGDGGNIPGNVVLVFDVEVVDVEVPPN